MDLLNLFADHLAAELSCHIHSRQGQSLKVRRVGETSAADQEGVGQVEVAEEHNPVEYIAAVMVVDVIAGYIEPD